MCECLQLPTKKLLDTDSQEIIPREKLSVLYRDWIYQHPFCLLVTVFRSIDQPFRSATSRFHDSDEAGIAACRNGRSADEE